MSATPSQSLPPPASVSSSPPASESSDPPASEPSSPPASEFSTPPSSSTSASATISNSPSAPATSAPEATSIPSSEANTLSTDSPNVAFNPFSTPSSGSTTQNPPGGTHKANIGMIAGVTSALGALALLIAAFCLFRWKKRRKFNNASIARPISPLTPPMGESHTLTSNRPSTTNMSGTRTTTPLSSLVTKGTTPSQKSHRIPTRAEWQKNSQQPHAGTDLMLSDENIPVNKAEFSAMRAEMRAMKTRLAVLEAEAADQPPDYVSSYTSANRSVR
ncbi:hypothetical protein PQX77_016707 [Marasmius sp. AFHP31]|nr:hypothetical protein PQX77_016707 [Marasmius sp. AFHP31]